METKSFKQLIQAGEIKRADAMKIGLDDIHEEPGFNLRDQTEDFFDGIKQFAQYIAAGGIFPALEVRPRPGGGVLIVEGHRRRLALRMARDELGAPIEWVPITQFVGNDAERTARILTSAESRHLSPLEVARGYKRLAAFGKTPDEIAAMVSKTRQHVDQLLILANANTDVHQLVAAGGVSAAVAVGMVRKHGEDAGKVLGGELDKAKAAGKGKVTAGTVKPWTPPAKIMAPMVDAVDELLDGLTNREHEELTSLRNGRTASNGTIMVSGKALLALLDTHTAMIEARNAKTAKAREKANKAAQTELAAN